MAMPDGMMPAAAAAPGPADAAPPAKKSGGATQLISDINDNMMKLVDILSQAKGAEDEAQQMGALVSQFQGIVDSLGQAPGAKKPEVSEPSGPVPMEAGVSGAKPAM